MSPESGRRFRVKDMRENKDLKRAERIRRIATRHRTASDRTDPIRWSRARSWERPGSVSRPARRREARRRTTRHGRDHDPKAGRCRCRRAGRVHADARQVSRSRQRPAAARPRSQPFGPDQPGQRSSKGGSRRNSAVGFRMRPEGGRATRRRARHGRRGVELSFDAPLTSGSPAKPTRSWRAAYPISGYARGAGSAGARGPCPSSARRRAIRSRW